MNENLSATFVLYCDWKDIIVDLTDEDVGKLFKAIFRYVNGGETARFDGRTGLGVAFKTICKQIDVNRKKYEQVVEKRRNAAKKRWEKQNFEAQGDANASFAMHNDNVNENGNVNVNDNVNGNENENGNVNDNIDASNASLPSVDFSAVELSADQLNSLVSFSSRPLVDFYIAKARDWQVKHKRKYKDAYSTIKGWIQAEKAKTSVSSERQQSFDISMLEELDREFVSRNGGANGG